LLFQVGCFYECYDRQAEAASGFLKLKRLKAGRGFELRCGFPVPLLARYRGRLLQQGTPVAVIREETDGPWLGCVKTRRVAESWGPDLPALKKMP